jgi:hypothetical protein
MHPDDYDKLAPFEELDHEPTDSDRVIAYLLEFGEFNETGGSLGWSDEGPPQE